MHSFGNKIAPKPRGCGGAPRGFFLDNKYMSPLVDDHSEALALASSIPLAMYRPNKPIIEGLDK